MARTNTKMSSESPLVKPKNPLGEKDTVYLRRPEAERIKEIYSRKRDGDD